ncbi:MAG: response regulator [Acidimicrobiia bacterium]
MLIVEDDADIRELVAFKLRQVGYDVRTAGNGEEGLQLAVDTPPDVVILDLMMPKLSGLEVCRELRSNDDTATIPIIMLTAKAQEADVERGFELGATDYVIKPFSPRELVSRVQAALGRTA